MRLNKITALKKTLIGITVVGKDKEGIVANFTNFVFERKGNLERVNQNVIKGLFGMYLEASFTKKIDVKRFDSDLVKLGKQLHMEVNTHHESNSQKNIAVFVTKEPHCLQTLIRAQSKKELKGKIAVSNWYRKYVIRNCKKSKITFCVN